MRKLLFISTLLLVFGILLFSAFSIQSQTSNTSHDYEYYYIENTDLDEEDTDMSQEPASTADQTDTAITRVKIDTTPGSMTVLVNREYPLPDDYKPDDLVVPDILFNFNYYNEKKLMRSEAADAIEQLFEDAEDAGLSLCAISGYRSYDRQMEIYKKNIRTKGIEHTTKFSAVPGCSEHQTGLSMDVSTASVSNRLEEVFAGTPEGKWLAKNSHLYGFTIRYPKDKSLLTGYAYEPWHIRYVGISLAKQLYTKRICLEEYYNYKPSYEMQQDNSYGTNIDVEDDNALPEPEPTNIPKRTAKPSPAPTPKKTVKTMKTEAPEQTASPTPTVSAETLPPEQTIEPVPSAAPEPSEPKQTPENSQPPIQTEFPVMPEQPAHTPDAHPESTHNTAQPEESQDLR